MITFLTLWEKSLIICFSKNQYWDISICSCCCVRCNAKVSMGMAEDECQLQEKNVGMMSLIILYMSFRPSHISTLNSPSFSVVHISHIKLMTTYNFSPTARHFQSFIFSSSWITYTVSLTVSSKSSQELLHHMKSGGFVGATYGNALGEKSQIPKKTTNFLKMR